MFSRYAGLAVEPSLAARGVVRCRHLKHDPKVGWKGIDVKLAHICCTDLFVTLVPGEDGRRVARISPQARSEAFQELMVFLAVEHGPYASFKDNVAVWRKDGQTAYLIWSKGQTYLQLEEDGLNGRLEP